MAPSAARNFTAGGLLNFETVFVCAGRRGLEIELAPGDLARITGAMFPAVSR